MLQKLDFVTLNMKYKDFIAAREFIEQKSLALMRHENKQFARVGFSPDNYQVYSINGRTFYAVSTRIFRLLLKEVLLKAMEIFPLNFGGGNAVSVIHAINKTEPLASKLKAAIRMLREENFCYIVENNNGRIPDKILRLDLFRHLDKIKNKKKRYDFTGGVFHALKHFSCQNRPLSTGKDKNEIGNPLNIVALALKAFFIYNGEFVDNNTYISRVPLNDKYNLKFVFYHETNTRVYFIKTVHKEKIRP